MGLSADGHLALAHRLQQGALHFGRRTIDFVCQDQIRKYGTEMGTERGGVRHVNHGTDHVARQQIRGELDTLELKLEHLPQRFYQQRLGETGHALKEDMPTDEQRNLQPLDNLCLTEHRLAELASNSFRPLGTSA